MPENFVTFLSTHSWIIAVVAVWTIPWKGVALWRAARNKSYAWFIILLVVNTLGILEIIYIFRFSRKSAPAQGYGANGKNIDKRIVRTGGIDDKYRIV